MSFAYFDAIFPRVPPDGRDMGYVVIAAYPGGKFDAKRGPTKHSWFAWPSQRDDLVSWCFANSEQDLYTVPALFKDRSTRKGHNIAHQWCAYADADTLPLDRVRTEPTVTVETSPGRHHLYWVTNTDDPQALIEISRTIASQHRDDGCDPGGWDAGQLLRVPGTTNSKRVAAGHQPWEIPGHPKLGATYTLQALTSAYPRYQVDREKLAASEMPPQSEWDGSQSSIVGAAEIFRQSARIYDLFEGGIRGIDTTGPGKRSATFALLLNLLARHNAPRRVAMHIAWNARCNKFKEDGRHPTEVWRELCKAYDDPANEPLRSSLVDPSLRKETDASEENPERKLTEFAESVHVLRPDERDRIPANTFIDQYQRWASTCTDAPGVYHRASAMTILASVFGEFGKCPTRHDINLTLWFFILGPTTRARKTTAMMMMVDILDDLSDEDFSYIIGSDATPEALNLLLPEKDGRTSVYYRDEAHGLLHEQSKKRYLVGSQEYETELFSGRVRSTLRAGAMKEQDTREPGVIRTNFIRFLCGTLEQVANALTIESYQSGHMARFLVAEADPPPLTEESMHTEQFDGQAFDEDPVRRALLNDLLASRAFWIGVTPPGTTVMVPFESAAWTRLQKAQFELYQAAARHELAEVLLPTVSRMGDSMMKMAVLLAMAERERVVKMPHLLKAMSLTEEWYRSTAKVAGRILHSQWANRQDEVLTAVQARKEGVSEQELYSRFRSKMTASELESILFVLGKAELIRKVPERGRVRYVPVARS